MIFSNLEHILNHIAFSIVSIVMTIQLINFLIDEKVSLYDSSKKGMIASFFCITGLLITRWLYSRHFPLSNLYESLIFLSWNLSIIHVVPFLKNKNNLSEITIPSAIFTQVFVTSGFLSGLNQSKILVPALQSDWLIMHVSMMVLGYAALLCGSLLAVALLVITFQTDIKLFLKGNLLLTEPFSVVEIFYKKKKKNGLINTLSFYDLNYYKSQLIQQLDNWSYRLLSLGFIFLTIGILSGAVWANEAWGSYWNWDPKETWAFITWTVFAIYLHIRTNKNWQSYNSAIVASIGFFIIWICYFGVNLLGLGLHSYGSFILTSN
uniref:Cytochrome c biogenesis protein CcsA n=1 Tax=Hydrostachys imbricata TaxID=86842 RepID=A0A5C0PZG8_9ASTE|nr:CcsA [Hydrostachys imbricata]QEJ82575.1 CcsA [Hydrostachys imbricata]